MDLEQYLQVVPYAALAVVITCINLCSLAIILWSKALMSHPQVILVINLILTHLLQGLVVMPVYALRKSREYPVSAFPIVCDTWRFSYMLTFYGTCLNVLLIALDRWLATRFFQKYASHHYRHKHFVGAVMVSWFYVISLCLLPFIVHDNNDGSENKSSSPFYCNYKQPHYWSSFMLICNTVLPYLSVIAIYLYIRKRIKKSAANTSYAVGNLLRNSTISVFYNNNNISHSNDNHSVKDRSVSPSKIVNRISRTKNKSVKRKSAQYRKVTKLTFRIIFIYGVTWTPSIVYYSIVTLNPDAFPQSYYVSKWEMVATYTIKLITFFNAAAAPVIYCYNHLEFRREAKKMFRLFRRSRKCEVDNSGTIFVLNR